MLLRGLPFKDSEEEAALGSGQPTWGGPWGVWGQPSTPPGSVPSWHPVQSAALGALSLPNPFLIY